MSFKKRFIFLYSFFVCGFVFASYDPTKKLQTSHYYKSYDLQLHERHRNSGAEMATAGALMTAVCAKIVYSCATAQGRDVNSVSMGYLVLTFGFTGLFAATLCCCGTMECLCQTREINRLKCNPLHYRAMKRD